MTSAALIDLAAPDISSHQAAQRLNEAVELVTSLGNTHIAFKRQKKALPEYKTFLTADLIDTLLLEHATQPFELVILNNILKPQQIFALTETLRLYGIRVWDRIDLILEIFARHAVSAEAKVQIELARIRHMGPRIFGMGTELSRQGGGIGTSGIGETNTEIMKRHLKEHERRIFQKLKRLEQSKDLQLKRRQREGFRTVALVGYTNAGKSSLMQTLTKKEHIAIKNALFVTLGSRVGKLFLPDILKNVLLADTIGFISDLPPDLISAFRSTLSEALHADLLLHVVDLSDPAWPEKITVVETILDDLGIGQKDSLLVFNKIDLLPNRFGKLKIQKNYRAQTPLFISAEQKKGLDELKRLIGARLFPLNKAKTQSKRTN